MKVKATKQFIDIVGETSREVGDMFECSDDRYKELFGLGLVEKVASREQAKKER